jgi:hypothetical protein
MPFRHQTDRNSLMPVRYIYASSFQGNLPTKLLAGTHFLLGHLLTGLRAHEPAAYYRVVQDFRSLARSNRALKGRSLPIEVGQCPGTKGESPQPTVAARQPPSNRYRLASDLVLVLPGELWNQAEEHNALSASWQLASRSARNQHLPSRNPWEHPSLRPDLPMQLLAGEDGTRPDELRELAPHAAPTSNKSRGRNRHVSDVLTYRMTNKPQGAGTYKLAA